MTLMDTSSLTFSKHEDLSFLVQTLHLCKSKLLDLHSLWISYTPNKSITAFEIKIPLLVFDCMLIPDLFFR
ncbi:MAG: hypothetical protein PWP25_1302 [Sphaerochaeta sp.]|jgi:hypothetical protein|nr:hypothetical protein [Sphaerochaeta sp.]MDN5334770.1 hypothetical protein [Sphaerochaeta sp.]